MPTARIFMSRGYQAIKLPRGYRFKGPEIEIFRRGDETILREKTAGMERVLDFLAAMPEDMFPKKRRDPKPQGRKGLAGIPDKQKIPHSSISRNHSLPGYIEERLRQSPPHGIRVVSGSTPVVAFGDARQSRVATLSWNPSRIEFLDRLGKELVGDKSRLETLGSLGETRLRSAPTETVGRVFESCNNYFNKRPYLRWFNKLETILKYVNASYFDGSACHLDFVQWATDPVWSGLSKAEQSDLMDADLPFLRRQLSQEKIRLLLLNGSGIVTEYKNRFGAEFKEFSISAVKRPLKLFKKIGTGSPMVLGWNLNLQTSRASQKEMELIGTAVKKIFV